MVFPVIVFIVYLSHYFFNHSEEWIDCGQRETLEETGLILKDMKYCAVVNAIVESEKLHYITLFVQGVVDTSIQSEPINTEPDKCEGWQWVEWDSIPAPEKLYCALRVLRQQNEYNPFAT